MKYENFERKEKIPKHLSSGFFKNVVSILSLLDCNSNLEHGINKLERREDYIVYVLNVVKLEELLERGELVGGNVILVFKNFVRLVLRFLFGFKSQYGKHDRINVEQKTEYAKHHGAYTVSVEYK